MTAASGSFPLFLKVDSATSLTGVLPLFTFGTTQSGVFSALPLYVECASGAGNLISGVLPLWLKTASLAPVSGVLPLFVEGGTTTLSASLPLFLGAPSGVTGTFPLFIRGSGTTAGGLPFTASLPLFLKRPETNYLSLFLRGPWEPASGILPLYTLGSSGITASMPIWISGHDVLGSSLGLYTHGV